MDNATQLEIVELGDAKEVTMGVWGPNTEFHPILDLMEEG